MRVSALLLALCGCQEATSLEPNRVPPPDRTVVNEGTLDEATDACGALDVDAPRRLSASAGDSDGVRLAVLPRPGADAWVAVGWLEHEATDPEPSPALFAAQVLLEDAVPLGDVMLFPASSPESLDLAPRPGSDQFVLATSDADQGGAVRLIGPLAAAGAIVDQPIALERLEQPSLVVGPDGGFAVGLEPGGDEPRNVRLAAVRLSAEGAVNVQVRTLPLEATQVLLAGTGSELALAWNDGTTARGVRLAREGDGPWNVPPEGDLDLGPVTGALRRAHGTNDLAVVVSMWGVVMVQRLADTKWEPIADGSQTAQLDDGFAATRGESGGRWAFARTWNDPAEPAPEIRIERTPGGTTCQSPGECARVTTDDLPSGAPDIVAVDGGYVVAWSDRLADGQTDVFVAAARCHATTNAPQR